MSCLTESTTLKSVTFLSRDFYHVRFCNCLVLCLYVLQYFAKNQVGSLPNPKGTLSNAQAHTKFHCFSNWH